MGWAAQNTRSPTLKGALAIDDANQISALGFLTVLEHAKHGLFGGYLVLNATGRPLEFHCTAPIRPNRAQEILYGPTLEPFLYGEQIGRTLLRKSKVKTAFVCTDREAVLAVRDHVSLPVALVTPRGDATDVSEADERGTLERGLAEREATPGRLWRLEGAHAKGCMNNARLLSFELGENRLAVLEGKAADRERIVEQGRALAASFDLTEPFLRIREAIEEAQRAVR